MSSYIIDFKDLKAGEYHFDFKVGESLFALYEGCEVLGGDCAVGVDMSRSESMVAFDVTIKGSVSVECDRCLDPCDVDIDFAAPLIVKFSDDEALVDEYDGEVMWMPTTSASVDLTHYIYESIILSLPYQRVHGEGGCNTEMLSRFIPAEDVEVAEDLEDGSEEEENISLPASELAKLMALKEKMNK